MTPQELTQAKNLLAANRNNWPARAVDLIYWLIVEAEEMDKLLTRLDGATIKMPNENGAIDRTHKHIVSWANENMEELQNRCETKMATQRAVITHQTMKMNPLKADNHEMRQVLGSLLRRMHEDKERCVMTISHFEIPNERYAELLQIVNAGRNSRVVSSDKQGDYI